MTQDRVEILTGTIMESDVIRQLDFDLRNSNFAAQKA